MKTNGKAVMILMALVGISVLIFLAEKKYLVAQPRGSTVRNYQRLPWAEQIIFLVEDFEGLSKGDAGTMHKAKFFSYGSTQISVDHSMVDKDRMASKTALKIEWIPDATNDYYGGWGKGVGSNIDLDTATDYFNLRIYLPQANGEDSIKISLQEDDDDDGVFKEDEDDVWIYPLSVSAKDEWQLISIPLKDFTDENKGGDGIFNVTKKSGIHNIVFSLMKPDTYKQSRSWYFDFICFTSMKVTNANLTDQTNQ